MRKGKIRFPLKLKDDAEVRSLQELRENFDLEKIIQYLIDETLERWLDVWMLVDEAEKVRVLDKGDKDIGRKLCEIFGVEPPEEEVDAEDIAWRTERENRLRQYTDNKEILAKVDYVAFDSGELYDILEEEDTDTIYLCNNSFVFNSGVLKYRGKYYIGIGKVEAVIKSTELVDFDTLGISFQNIHFDRQYEALTNLAPAMWFQKGEEAYSKADFVKANEYFTKAANAGNSDAFYKLGELYEKGEGVDQSNTTALEFYNCAANMGNIDAMCVLGNMYRYGRTNIKKDKGKAVDWFGQAAEYGNVFAMLELANMYRYGEGIKENKKEAAKWFQKAVDLADNDENIADKYTGNMYDALACMYRLGEGIEKDASLAMELYIKAAKYGNDDAMLYIGFMYHTGDGVEPTPQKAIEWYNKAMENGNVMAMNILGGMYVSGKGVIKDQQKAAKLFKKAAELGDARAKYELGWLYQVGEGVKQNLQKAKELYEQAANGGIDDAMRLLGDMYRIGEVVPRDYYHAFDLYERAAESGNADAMGWLGVFYRDGAGVAQNIDKAIEWFQKAADNGNEEANEALHKIVSIRNTPVTTSAISSTSNSTSSIFERVKLILSEQFDENINNIEWDSYLDDYGADSLDALELVTAFEQEFNIEIPDDVVRRIHTVSDVVQYIELSI